MNKILCVLILFSTTAIAQRWSYPNPSPHTKLVKQVGNVTIEINYDRPATRERKIFGELVPYGNIWRTGAAEATTIAFDNDVKIEGVPVKAGKYTLFTVPNKTEWELILNAVPNQYGA
mgnify:CR=1 FL=1